MMRSSARLLSCSIVICLASWYLLASPALADEKFLTELMQQNCSDCHAESGEETSGNFRISDLQVDDGKQANSAWERVFTVILTSQMPPPEAPELSRKDRLKAIDLLRTNLKDSDVVNEWKQKMRYPEYGNYVDHISLFDGSVNEAAFSPSRIWKKSSHIFDSLANRGMGFRPGRYGQRSGELAKLKQPFTMEDKAGVRDFAAVMLADSATLGTLMRNAEALVDKHLSGAIHERRVRELGPIPDAELPKDKKGKPIRPRFPKTAEEFSSIILCESKILDEQVRVAVDKMFNLIIERQPTSDEQQRYLQLYRQCETQSNPVEGLRMTLVAIAVSPPAVYRVELGQGACDQHGRQFLSPANLAFSIAYSLTDQKPDNELLSAARNGRLQTRDDVRREVARYWDDDQIAKPRILRFFHEFFGYDAAPSVFKDAARFGKDYRKVPEALVKDADTLVMHIVRQDKDVLSELLTTDKYFVAHTGNEADEQSTRDALLAFYEYYKDKPWREFPYQVPKEHMAHVRSIHRMFTHANGNVTKRWMNYLDHCDQQGIEPMPMQGGRDYITAYNLSDRSFSFPVKQPFALAPKQRIGILMHPAWLIAHSLNLDNDPVRRGKWIRERLLADTIPELPITVDARIPDTPDQSLRERFHVTREQDCWRCHVKMNPLGMPFELYDDFGRHRQREKLHAKGQFREVDSTGALSGTDNPKLDGDVADPLHLVRRLAKSKRVRQSFVRHAFRYWMGRNEQLTDSQTLIQADRAYVESGGSFRALVISLLTSDSFLYRRSDPQAGQGRADKTAVPQFEREPTHE